MAAIDQNAGGNSPVKKKQKKMMLALGGVLLLIALSVAFVGQPAPRQAPPNPQADIKKSFSDPTPKVNQADMWRTQEAARVQSLQDEIAGIRKQLDRENGRPAVPPEIAGLPPPPSVQPLPALPPLPPPPQSGQKGIAPVAGAPIGPIALSPVGAGVPGALPTAMEQAPRAGILKIDFTDTRANKPAVAAMSDPGATVEGKTIAAAYIPPGSFVRAINLTGIDAPTGGQAESNPHPMLFRVVDFAQLPNKFKANYKECFVTAAGHGDLSSERALIRLDKISCVSKDGVAVDADLKGYVSDETGKTGMKGRLVSKQGQVVANAMLAGIASGIGSAFSNSATTSTPTALGPAQTVNPSESFKYGVGQGVSKGMDKLADYFLKQADKLYPVVEVDSGRQVDLVFLQGVTMDKQQKPQSDVK